MASVRDKAGRPVVAVTGMGIVTSLAALAVARGKLFAPCDGSGFEAPYEDALDRVIVTSVGHFRGEGLALVETVR